MQWSIYDSKITRVKARTISATRPRYGDRLTEAHQHNARARQMMKVTGIFTKLSKLENRHRNLVDRVLRRCKANLVTIGVLLTIYYTKSIVDVDLELFCPGQNCHQLTTVSRHPGGDLYLQDLLLILSATPNDQRGMISTGPFGRPAEGTHAPGCPAFNRHRQSLTPVARRACSNVFGNNEQT